MAHVFDRIRLPFSGAACLIAIIAMLSCDGQSDLCGNAYDFPPAGSDTTNVVIITDTRPDSLQRAPFSLDSLKISGDTLGISITHGGGCGEHDYVLYMSPAAFLESFPVQANLYLRHEDHDDPCDALLVRHLSFNVCPIAELYQLQYGRKDEIILNVFSYIRELPGERLQVHYFPK